MTAIPQNILQRLDKEMAAVTKPFLSQQKGMEQIPVSYSGFFADKMLVIRLIREGIPYSLFNLIQGLAPFDEADWAQFLNISTKSLQRYKQSEQHFKPIHSEKILELAEVTNAGLDVFGSAERFRLWLDTPNFSLGGMKPVELLKDSYGKEMVMSELVQINHGILA